MKLFFNSMQHLNKYACEVKAVACCPHCANKHFLISHGFVYKKTVNGAKCIIGKRIFCSNRFSRSGCGRTFQLYLSLHLPRIHYDATHLNIFVHSITNNESIYLAYSKATGCYDSRNAYRWLKKLHAHLILFRGYIYKSGLDVLACLDKHQDNRFRSILASTLAVLFIALKSDYCQHFQEMAQQAFI